MVLWCGFCSFSAAEDIESKKKRKEKRSRTKEIDIQRIILHVFHAASLTRPTGLSPKQDMKIRLDAVRNVPLFLVAKWRQTAACSDKIWHFVRHAEPTHRMPTTSTTNETESVQVTPHDELVHYCLQFSGTPERRKCVRCDIMSHF